MPSGGTQPPCASTVHQPGSVRIQSLGFEWQRRDVGWLMRPMVVVDGVNLQCPPPSQEVRDRAENFNYLIWWLIPLANSTHP